jgi:glycerol kinase
VGYWNTVADIQSQWEVDRKFTPQMEQKKISELLKGWQRAVRASVAWAEER